MGLFYSACLLVLVIETPFLLYLRSKRKNIQRPMSADEAEHIATLMEYRQ